jgi:transcription elongation GreA/GreB family factor
MHRQAAMARQQRVAAFFAVPANRAAFQRFSGTVVDVEDQSSGEKETFTILGAWDGDLEKNIISYLSESAKSLIGKTVGEETDLPTEALNGTRRVKINAIRAFAA